MRIIPDLSPKLFTLSAAAVGYLLIDDLTSSEQNALGNWLMLVAQVLCTNAYYEQVQKERKSFNKFNNEETINMILKMMHAMSKEVEELKKNI